MPNTCRTDTFMSGKPEISCLLIVAAVVITPPRSRAFPKPDIHVWLRMGASNKPSRERGRAEARPQIKVPLVFHKDRHGTQFLEGCPANHAAFSLGLGTSRNARSGWCGTFHAARYL